jgi:hypothetical protein
MDIYAKLYSAKESLFGGLAPLFRFKHFKIYALALFLLNLFLWLFAYSIFIKSNQSLIFLHYNVDFGVSLIGEAQKVFVLPILGLVIFLFNLLISSSFAKSRDFKFFSHLLLGSAVMAHIFLAFSLASIYLINFR